MTLMTIASPNCYSLSGSWQAHKALQLEVCSLYLLYIDQDITYLIWMDWFWQFIILDDADNKVLSGRLHRSSYCQGAQGEQLFYGPLTLISNLGTHFSAHCHCYWRERHNISQISKHDREQEISCILYIAGKLRRATLCAIKE